MALYAKMLCREINFVINSCKDKLDSCHIMKTFDAEFKCSLGDIHYKYAKKNNEQNLEESICQPFEARADIQTLAFGSNSTVWVKTLIPPSTCVCA